MSFFGPSFFESVKEKKQNERKNAIDRASKILSELPVSPEADTILTAPAWQIAEKIKSREWSSLTVVTTFARRCIEAHNDTNCLTEGNVCHGPHLPKS